MRRPMIVTVYGAPIPVASAPTKRAPAGASPFWSRYMLITRPR